MVSKSNRVICPNPVRTIFFTIEYQVPYASVSQQSEFGVA